MSALQRFLCRFNAHIGALVLGYAGALAILELSFLMARREGADRVALPSIPLYFGSVLVGVFVTLFSWILLNRGRGQSGSARSELGICFLVLFLTVMTMAAREPLGANFLEGYIQMARSRIAPGTLRAWAESVRLQGIPAERKEGWSEADESLTLYEEYVPNYLRANRRRPDVTIFYEKGEVDFLVINHGGGFMSWGIIIYFRDGEVHDHFQTVPWTNNMVFFRK